MSVAIVIILILYVGEVYNVPLEGINLTGAGQIVGNFYSVAVMYSMNEATFEIITLVDAILCSQFSFVYAGDVLPLIRVFHHYC